MTLKLFVGNISRDKRGIVRYINKFSFKGVKRFYEVINNNSSPRAFHGHMKEEKYAYVTAGKILLCAVYLDNIKRPSKENKVERFILSSENPQIVYIPPRFANGFRSLEKNSRVIFFSTSTLKQSLKDDYRFPFDYWGKEVWKT